MVLESNAIHFWKKQNLLQRKSGQYCYSKIFNCKFCPWFRAKIHSKWLVSCFWGGHLPGFPRAVIFLPSYNISHVINEIFLKNSMASKYINLPLFLGNPHKNFKATVPFMKAEITTVQPPETLDLKYTCPGSSQELLVTSNHIWVNVLTIRNFLYNQSFVYLTPWADWDFQFVYKHCGGIFSGRNSCTRIKAISIPTLIK